ncbi:anti-sigma-K factor RskA [Mumia flava]|uniref:Regulator of SigK n=1 Tax=Mumia flava TaxID=1348852 RepID=A0A0B2B6C9_9ACTN|nr:anti-sigma factor [Mumia flava]PJJ53947.1 anti-sigma-K factor RskA [Mumia flava]
MTSEPHNLAAAYALDALDEAERVGFEEHLAQCTDCAEEVRGFRETAARLADAARAEPPPGLRTSVMEAVARTPQERPGVTPLHKPRRGRRAVLTALAAAAAAAIVALGSWAVVERDRADDLAADQAAITAVLSAPDARMSAAEVEGGGTVRVVRSEKLDDAVVVVAGLPELDAEHDYQVWTLRGDDPTSAGVLGRDDQGPESASSRLVSDFDGVTAVAITVEPAGGSDAPTTNPIAAVSTA